MLTNLEANKGNKERRDFPVFIIDEHNSHPKSRSRAGADAEQ